MGSLDDWLDEKTQPVVTEDRTAPTEPFWRRINWSNWLLIGLVAFFLVSKNVDCDRGVLPDDGDAVVIDTPGKYLLVLRDESETRDQSAAINSTDIAEWAEENGVEYRKIFDDSDLETQLKRLEPVWSELAEIAAEPPSMTFSNDGVASTKTVPAGTQKMIAELESLE